MRHKMGRVGWMDVGGWTVLMLVCMDDCVELGSGCLKRKEMLVGQMKRGMAVVGVDTLCVNGQSGQEPPDGNCTATA